MASDNVITVSGNLTEDPELRFTPNGVAVTSCRVAVSERRFNKDSGQYEDAHTSFFNCNVWRDQAENVAGSLVKGARVVVVGRLRSRQYEDREGQTRWATEIEADEICPSLRWATAVVTRTPRNSGGQGAPAAASSAAPVPADDDVPF